MTASHRPDRHDVVIVGARAAGAATGMLLARAGLDVLLLERSNHGNDTLSTHALMRGGVLQLHRWGLLDQVIAAGTPAVRRATFQIGDELLPITIKPSHGVDALYAPRRTVLDPILADAAVAAGAQIRYGTTVTGVTRNGDGRVGGVVGRDTQGRSFEAEAAITVGADGMNSPVARWVAAPVERRGTAAGAVVYGYWRGVEHNGYEWNLHPGAATGAIPTNGGETCIFVSTSPERFRREVVSDPAAGVRSVLADAAPELADRLARAQGPDRLRRFPGRPGFMRRSWGPGWALAGDAGYFKDPITAHGLTDALRDAELLAGGIVAALVKGEHEADSLARYQTTRDELSDALFTITDQIANHSWDTAEVGALLLRLSSAMTDEVEFLEGLDQHALRLPGLSAA
jgi:2-polyprenyl-6-methoxyphenol hydroxylase-like FAD-dependent oxidoreductase